MLTVLHLVNICNEPLRTLCSTPTVSFQLKVKQPTHFNSNWLRYPNHRLYQLLSKKSTRMLNNLIFIWNTTIKLFRSYANNKINRISVLCHGRFGKGEWIPLYFLNFLLFVHISFVILVDINIQLRPIIIICIAYDDSFTRPTSQTIFPYDFS